MTRWSQLCYVLARGSARNAEFWSCVYLSPHSLSACWCSCAFQQISKNISIDHVFCVLDESRWFIWMATAIIRFVSHNFFSCVVFKRTYLQNTCFITGGLNRENCWGSRIWLRYTWYFFRFNIPFSVDNWHWKEYYRTCSNVCSVHGDMHALSKNFEHDL